MKFYAENGARRTRQLVVDALLLAWCVAWIALGIWVTSSFDDAKDGAKQLETSGHSLSGHMSDAANLASSIPFVGGQLKDPFQQAAGAATSMGAAGHDLADGLGTLALLLGFLTAVSPLFVALLPWLLARVRYARRAGRVARLRGMPGADKLLALDALATASPRKLEAISPDPAGDWQAGDPDVTRRLADLALSRLGLRGDDSGARPAAHGRGGAATTGTTGTTSQPWARTNAPDRAHGVDTEGDETHWA